MNWFSSPDGTERFEVSEEVLLRLIREGKVTRDALVWCEGMADWKGAGKAKPGWFDPPVLEVPAPPPPPPAEVPPPVDSAGPVAIAPPVDSAPAADIAPPVESAPTAEIGPPADRAPTADIGPPPAPVEISPWSRGTAEPPEGPRSAPPIEDAPPSVDLVLPPAPPPSDYTPSLSHPTPPPPGYSPLIVPAQPRDSAAMTSVISGAIGLAVSMSGFCCCFGSMIAPVAGVTSVVFGHMAYGKAQGHVEAENDKNLAVVGLVLGYLTLAVSIGLGMVQLLTGALGAAFQNFH